jgi:RNA polymerase sigma factor (TIGR02999 family)
MSGNDGAGDVTSLLAAIQGGDAGASSRLVTLIYEQLRRQAIGMMTHEPTTHSWQPTELVHETLLKLGNMQVWQRAPNRHYLFAAATTAMRNVLVDHARTRARAKRGGDWDRVPLDGVLEHLEQAHGVEVLALHEALEELAVRLPEAARAIELHYFGGFSQEEVAEQMQCSVSKVERTLRLAKGWLFNRLKGATS